MDVFDAVRTILAVRGYQDKPIAPELVRKIVEAGRLTASGGNGQPWHFIVVQDRATLNQLGAVLRSGPYVVNAPLAIAVAIEKTPIAVADGSRAIQSMTLTAWAEGIGSNWIGFAPLDEVKSVLDIPNTLDVLAVISFGYPAKAVGMGKKKRKPLSEVAHMGRFGNPFA